MQQAEDAEGGETVGDWTEQFTCAARIRPLVGSEPVIAQRLTGVQPAVITVRSSSLTRTVDSSWRIRNARTGTQYNIRAVTPDERRAYIDFLCEAGVAQ
jgi:SPP1 family predicted phage head-tail adaptor